MLISKNDLTMTASHISVNRNEETNDIIYSEPVIINCWLMKNKKKYIQSDNGFLAVDMKGYILGKDNIVKKGDLLDGLIISDMNEINDFDGSIDHYEVWTVMK